jgi:hypothetical protein
MIDEDVESVFAWGPSALAKLVGRRVAAATHPVFFKS